MSFDIMFGYREKKHNCLFTLKMMIHNKNMWSLQVIRVIPLSQSGRKEKSIILVSGDEQSTFFDVLESSAKCS